MPNKVQKDEVSDPSLCSGQAAMHAAIKEESADSRTGVEPSVATGDAILN